MPSKLRREVKAEKAANDGLKPTQDRIVECVSLLKQLNEKYDIPFENPSIKVLNARMREYYKFFDADASIDNPIEGSIPLISSNRTIFYRFPLRADKFVEIWLKVDSGERVYPDDLKALMEEA